LAYDALIAIYIDFKNGNDFLCDIIR